VVAPVPKLCMNSPDRSTPQGRIPVLIPTSRSG
jgi:hypothetical protein